MTPWLDNVISPGELLSALACTRVLFHMFFGASGIVFVLSTAALPFSYFVISVGMRGWVRNSRRGAACRARRLLTVRRSCDHRAAL